MDIVTHYIKHPFAHLIIMLMVGIYLCHRTYRQISNVFMSLISKIPGILTGMIWYFVIVMLHSNRVIKQADKYDKVHKL